MTELTRTTTPTTSYLTIADDAKEGNGGSTPSQYAIPAGCTDVADVVLALNTPNSLGVIFKQIFDYLDWKEGSAKDLQDLIELANLNFAQGNIVKAIFRLGKKNKDLYELNKIEYFLERELAAASKDDFAQVEFWLELLYLHSEYICGLYINANRK